MPKHSLSTKKEGLYKKLCYQDIIVARKNDCTVASAKKLILLNVSIVQN